ncbi:hypothetical protein KQX54_007054 [Cotesia glomerata]|uniref:Uncharacterized protein n=1 Tax=Cotesia glomerata TaxID=32391 RepID=A0AAV7IQV5_COTGL|nr:hypothetical protein KQX54_007054 [Cotesia glomerata]
MRIGVMSCEQIKFFEFLSLQRRAVLKCADCSGCFDEPMTACLGQMGSNVEFSSLVLPSFGQYCQRPVYPILTRNTEFHRTPSTI